jgi:hypothetical protein
MSGNNPHDLGSLCLFHPNQSTTPSTRTSRHFDGAVQRGLVLGGAGVGQLGDELAQVLPGDAGEARMGKGRTDPCWSSHPGMIVQPSSCPHDPRDQPASRAPSRSMSRPPESRDDLKASRRCITTPELGEGRRGT